ncbi:glycosyltransferase [Streptococcus oricebi]|uniref:Glycosyl transferase n=1 Tax=Streptococcus oricebi TaxID=1547447 RepID=A0ABS5B5N5_9STRE|nr:nucleotide disphospho-sugar-binding domain-containing protein [Streptococcus oricebi]MBP2624152.1 glycosyl transferase [Streptococcus oricebi]
MEKIKIDVLAVPLSGHLYPLMDLVAPLLKDPRFQIRLFTGVKKIPLAQAVGFETVTIFPDDPERVERVANNPAQLNPWTAFQQLSASFDLINELSDDLLQEWQVNRPDLVIADFITLSPALVCRQLGIPWITSMATQFALESKDGPPCFFGGWTDRPSFWIRLRNALGRKLTRGTKRLVFWGLYSKLKRYQIKLYNERGEENIYSPYSILGLGMEEVELKSGFPAHYRWAGPCCASFENPVDFHLDLERISKKKVLVSCGTQLLWGKDNLVALAQNLADKFPDYHFVVTLGNSERRGMPPEEVRPNLTVVAYLPYSFYLAKFDYVIHHGGAGVFYNCIEACKPALILPHDYDQADYAVRGQEAQIAYVASKDRPSQIESQFKRLIERRDWSQLEELSQTYQTYQASQILLEEIERILGEGRTR